MLGERAGPRRVSRFSLSLARARSLSAAVRQQAESLLCSSVWCVRGKSLCSHTLLATLLDHLLDELLARRRSLGVNLRSTVQRKLLVDRLGELCGHDACGINRLFRHAAGFVSDDGATWGFLKR